MKKIIFLSLGLLLFSLIPEIANAQSQRNPCFYATSTSTGCTSVSGTNPLPVTASVSVTGFTPNGSYGTLTATASSSASTALPSGATVALQNTSQTIDVSCVVDPTSATATTNKILIHRDSTIFIAPGTNAFIACINQTGSASNVVAMAGGSGLGTNYGVGGGGGGGAVTIADGADVTQGAIADAAATAGSTGTISAKLRYMTTQLDNINTNVQAAVPAGTNRIGYASDDPCANKTKLNKQFTTNGTASVELVAVSGSTTIYVCSLAFIVSSASKVAFTTGTGTACATSNAAVIGSTTANIANSMSFAANGGMTLGNGGGTIAKGAASSAFCMVNSVDQYTSGNITYVQE